MMASPRRPRFTRGLLLLALAVLALFVSAAPASAQNISGAIFTTFADGTTVNGNIYPSKASVYLNGGPQNENAAGLPDGTYYFQVTDPAAKILLSTDDISCRQVLVVNGIFAGATGPCPHANGAQNTNNGGSIPVQLIPFNDTPNAGGEYKVWLTNVNNYDPTNCSNFGFCDDKSKTDNFKIQEPAAHIKVCKFNDLNDNGSQDDGEPLIPHWPITATGVNSTPVNTQTDDNGCVSFTIASFSNPDGTETVTFTEGTQGPTWAQTAPPDGSCTLTANSGSVNALDACSVTGGVITLTISPGEDLSAPNFGNNSNCSNNNSCTEPPVVTKTANPRLTRTFKWTITKSVDKTEIDTSGSATFNYTVSVSHDDGTDSGWQATGSIRVSNPNSSDMTGVSVSDVVDNGGSCTVDTTGFSGTLPANSHIDFPYTCTYQSLPPTGTNTATATSDDGSGTGTASVDFSTATINIVDGTITVTDTFGGTMGTASYTDTNPITFTYSHTFTDPPGTCTTHDNTATFTTDDTSTTGSDTKTVKVCVGADLKASKTAVTAFNSAITKNVDNTLVEQAGGSITFNYTVNVITSNWTVAGGITVTNPNNWEAITANVSDLLSDGGGICSVTGGSNVSVPASSSVTLPYVCTFALVPSAGSGINTAMATWNAAAFFTPDGSASGTAAYVFGSLTVTDTFKGALGTVTIPPGSATFTYSRTVTVPPGTCQNFDNTATIVETNQTASKTVTACNTNTGALTMGFWQNKNGQGIITSFCGGTSGMNLDTFLRQFNPFQDLSATATCSQDASYVTGIIKAATCTSTSNTCNAMLRSQMLATALDVYFSDPTLGGNRIGAFNGLGGTTPALGGVAIDLSKVCAMLDGSGGGTCSGVTEDARPEFGIAPPALGTTVLQMLLYSDFTPSAVNGSPVTTSPNGSTWYNNIKARQVIAKDAFDSINNQKALIAPPGTTASPSF